MPTKDQMDREWWGGKYSDLIYLQELAKKNGTIIKSISMGDKLFFDKESYAENANNISADILKSPHHGTEGFAPNSFFEKVNPKYVIVPSPKQLWCSNRSKRSRILSKNNHYITYINGFHGHITVTSYDNNYTITTENNSTNICEDIK